MNVLRNTRGIAIIYVTLFLLVLGILFFALGIDVGWMAYVKTQGQAATDASALAAAAAIPNANSSGNKTRVDELAFLFNSNNTVMNQSAGIVSTDVELCDGDANANPPNCNAGVAAATAGGVRVTRTYNTPLFFTRFLNGAGSTNLAVSSTAWLGGPGDGSPTLPVTVCGQAIGYDFSNPYNPGTCDPSIIGRFTPNGSDNAGYWNFEDSANADDCKNMVEGTTAVPRVTVGQDIELNNGAIASCHQKIFDRFKDCTETICADPDSAAAQACTVILPVVDCPSSINQNEEVKGFVALCITQVDASGNPKTLDGRLTCGVEMDGSLGSGAYLGVYADKPVLVK